MSKALCVTVTAVVAALGGSAAGRTQPAAGRVKTIDDAGWCREDDRGAGRGARHCEVREFTLPAGGRIEVDSAPNGGVQAQGEPRGDVRVLARVETRADSPEEARALAAQVSLSTTRTIRASGPESRDRSHWTVSYRLWVPERSDLTLRAQNGGLHVKGVAGDLDLRTLNGGVHLADVGGRVRARTTNGGLHVELADAWRGQGLDAETTNGGVHLDLPAGLDAHLEASTVNGRIHADLPVSGGRRAGRTTLGGSISTDLGRGGATLRLVTTNGGVHVTRR